MLLFIILLFLSQNIIGDAYQQDRNQYRYEMHYKDLSLQCGQTTAVLVIAYNRPEYLVQCIRSIKQNPESQELVFIFALDGGPRAKQAQNINIIKNSGIKNVVFLLRNRNYGCPKNHIDSKRFAFEWCKFKEVIVIEEDVVISPYYFSFLLNFYDWAQAQWENIGVVQGWTKGCYLSAQQKKQQLHLVRENPLYWCFVSYCIDDRCWQKISPILYEFEKFIDQIPTSDQYEKERSKPFHWHGMPRIRQWVQSLVHAKLQTTPVTNPRYLKSKLQLTREFLAPDFLAAQDVMMGFALYMNDLIKLHPLVNRAIHIGKYGISTNQQVYDNWYAKMRLDIFEQDKEIKSFQLI